MCVCVFVCVCVCVCVCVLEVVVHRTKSVTLAFQGQGRPEERMGTHITYSIIKHVLLCLFVKRHVLVCVFFTCLFVKRHVLVCVFFHGTHALQGKRLL